jgi:hypothetical protein
MPDYSKGKIYKIYGKTHDLVYYGSTAQRYACNRKADHNKDYKRWKAGKARKCSSYDIIDTGDWIFEVVEKYPCSSKEELTKREGWYIANNKCINQCRAGMTKKEQKREEYIKHRDRYLKKSRDWYQENKNKVINCECGSTYKRANQYKHFRTKNHRENTYK